MIYKEIFKNQLILDHNIDYLATYNINHFQGISDIYPLFKIPRKTRKLDGISPANKTQLNPEN